MQTIIKPGIWKILKIFYLNNNKTVHLREIARQAKANESTVFMHLNTLVKNGFLKTEIDGNLKKFSLTKKSISELFPLFDYERLENLPLLRKNAVKIYLNAMKSKPVMMVVFGSTAKENYKDDSDLDILEVSNQKDSSAKQWAEAQTGIRIQIFHISEKQFAEELKSKKDMVIQSALNSGFPVFNNKHFYEVVYE